MGEATGSPQADAGQARPSVKGKGVRKRALWVVLPILLVGGAVGVSLYYLHARSHKSTDDAFIAGHITFISPRVAGHVMRVHVDDNQLVREGDLLVELDPGDRQVALDAARAAHQVAVARAEAARIGVELSRVSSYAGLDEARAALKLAEAGAEAARTGVTVAQARLDEAKAQVDAGRAAAEEARAQAVAAEVAVERDRADLQRYEEMLKSNTVSQQTLDHAAAAARQSEANLQAMRKREAAAQAQVVQAEAAVAVAAGNLAQAGSHLAEAEATIAQARARLAAAESAPQQVALAESQARVAQAQQAQAAADMAQVELTLSYTKVSAPTAGRVTRKSVELGAFVQVGQALLTLVPDDLWVVANFKETDLAPIQAGQPVDVFVDAYPGKVFKAHVDSAQAGSGAAFSLLPPENATGYYIKVVQRVPVKIVFEEPPELTRYHLGPGMSVVPVVHVLAPPVSAQTARRSAQAAERAGGTRP